MQQGDWISVKDELPDIDVNVLVCTSNGKVLVSSMYCWDDVSRWRGSWTMTASITHWMPIILPKEYEL